MVQQLALQQSGEDAFTAVDPTATPMPLVFRKENKAVVRAWWGETEYVRDGEVLTVETDPRGLSVQRGDLQLALEQSGDDAFTAVDPTATPLPLVFRKESKAVVRAWWGETEYVRDGVEFSALTPAKLAALTGYYESDDPWRGSFRVIAQGRDLTIDGTNPLTPLGAELFRAGKDAWSPERLRFDAWLDGKPQRATASGADYLRRPA